MEKKNKRHKKFFFAHLFIILIWLSAIFFYAHSIVWYKFKKNVENSKAYKIIQEKWNCFYQGYDERYGNCAFEWHGNLYRPPGYITCFFYKKEDYKPYKNLTELIENSYLLPANNPKDYALKMGNNFYTLEELEKILSNNQKILEIIYGKLGNPQRK